MPSELNDIIRSLGGITAKLEMIERRQEEDRITSEQHRSDLRLTIAAQSTATAALNSKVEVVTGKVERVQEDVEELKPWVNDWRAKSAQAEGAAKMVMVLRVLVFGAASMIAGIVAWLSNVFMSKP